jgi:carbon-monoxide dehydrogenase large subunit
MKRKEDLRVLLAETRYVDDIDPPGVVYMGLIRSPYAHARIINVDGAALANDPRTLLFLPPDEINPLTNHLPLIQSPAGCRNPNTSPLAGSMTTYVGEPIAAVVTTSRYDIPDLIEKVSVDFEPLPAITDASAAVKDHGNLVYGSWGDNIAYSHLVEKGRVDAAFDSADEVVRERFQITRQYGAAIEPRGVISMFERGSGNLTVISSTQWPHFLGTMLAETLKYPENLITVIAPDVGGGFGNKQDIYREEVLSAIASMKLGRPVKWVATRTEDFQSTVHSGDQSHDAELALTKEGRFLGFRDEIIADIGAFGPMSLGPPMLTVTSMTGPYNIENVKLNLQCVVTNKVPLGAYRGFGQQQAAFVLERLVDEAASKLGIGELELREMNLITSFPYVSPAGRVIDSGNYRAMLRKARQVSSYDNLIRERTSGNLLRGIGVAFGFEGGGIGPSVVQTSSGARHKGYENVTLELLPDGNLAFYTSLSPHGQGLETTLSQVCADLMGVTPERVSIIHGDSRRTPYGFGTWGSRSAVLGAAGMYKCALLLKSSLVKIASKSMGIPESELVYEQGGVRKIKEDGSGMTLKELARFAYEGNSDSELRITVKYEPPSLTVSGGFHIAVVDVDPETGAVRLVKYIMVDDSGVMINPSVVEGQLLGGIAQGIGTALLEGIIYSEEGQPLTTSFLEGLIPSATDIPEVELFHFDTPTPANELGIKGMGESGIIGPSAAIGNAISNALRLRGFIVRKTPILSHELWPYLHEKLEAHPSLSIPS